MINIKKIAVSGLAFILSASALTGCGSNDKTAVKEASEAFMEAVKTNDKDGINQYSNSDVASGYFVSLFDGDYVEEQLVSSLGNPSLDDETMAKMDEFYSMYATMMDKYEITEVVMNDDGSATTSVTMTTNFPFDVISSEETSTRVQTATASYNEANQEELTLIATEEGTEAATNRAYNDIILIVMDIYEEAILGAEQTTYKIALNLEKNEETGTWYVKSVQSHDSKVAGTGAPATETDTSAIEASEASTDVSTEASTNDTSSSDSSQ